MVLCDVFSKDTKCTNHITDWFDFRCCYGFGENNRSAVKRPTGYVTVRPRPSPTNSRPLATNAPEKLTAGRPILVSLEECRNLLVSSCKRILIAKGRELNSKSGLRSDDDEDDKGKIIFN